MFEVVKKGYNPKQVGEFVFKANKIITELRTKNAELGNEISNFEEEIAKLKLEKEEKNAIALKSIENEDINKKLYEIEILKLNTLIQKWDTTLNDIRTKYGVVPDIEKQEQAFKSEINDQTQNMLTKVAKQYKEEHEKVYHKQLLTKITDSINDKAAMIDQNIHETKKVIGKNENQSSAMGKDYVKILNRYLEETNDDFDTTIEADYKSTAFGIPDYFPEPNESGFDLKEAVNPKDSLEDIMSDFDFYNPEENMKKKKKKK